AMGRLESLHRSAPPLVVVGRLVEPPAGVCADHAAPERLRRRVARGLSHLPAAGERVEHRGGGGRPDTDAAVATEDEELVHVPQRLPGEAAVRVDDGEASQATTGADEEG